MSWTQISKNFSEERHVGKFWFNSFKIIKFIGKSDAGDNLMVETLYVFKWQFEDFGDKIII